jgi:hypothetical protein
MIHILTHKGIMKTYTHIGNNTPAMNIVSDVSAIIDKYS